MNEISETKITLTISSNYSSSKIFNLPNLKYNTTKMSLKLFYSSMQGFLLHLISRPSIHVAFRITYVKHEMSKRTVGYVLKVMVRDVNKLLLKQL